MEWVETTGRTVEEAKDAALDQLGVDEQDAEFEVLEEAKSGLFGRLRAEARVRARVRPTTPPPKLDRRDRRRRARDDDGSTAAPAPDRDAIPSGDTPAPSRRRSGGATPPAPEGGETMSEPVDLEATAAAVRSFVEGLLDAFGVEGAVAVEEVDTGVLEARVTGSDLGLLIGPRGQTVDAVQELVRSAVPHDGGTRLRVDIGGYRERRREALARFATEIASQVRDSGEPVSLEPMSAADRKVVHDTVNGLDGVRTTSEGEDPRRRVVVHPT